ncbi:hypothetical protein Tco_0649013 [Tanacetum coccineum]
MEECHKLLTDKVDDAILKYNVSKPLPLDGEPGILPSNLTSSSTKIWSIFDTDPAKIGRLALSILKYEGSFLSISRLRATSLPDHYGLKRSGKYDIATGGFKDNDSTLTDSLLKETAEPSELTCVS